jgi:hypothetical protein
VTVGRGVVVVLVAEHNAVVPPFNPPQVQVYVPVFVVTDDAVPSVQRFVVGGTEKVAPLLVPQEPFCTPDWLRLPIVTLLKPNLL